MTTHYLESGKLATASPSCGGQERRNKICVGRHSAKGAISIQKPGATPQACTNIKPSALKARFTFGAGSLNGYLELNRAFSACFWLNRIPGALPKANGETAPLALNKAELGMD
jgi:hypothetical protein